ncbi:hypothetical protein H7142_01110 [Candidatus Saccharibacteria bacterium]|nr:hypothetical protein [Candidatus Saccharibacteria bacterium]
MSKNPRTEVFFPVVQTPADTDYVPLPTRDAAMIAMFEGRPRGIRIAWQQKVGSEAAARAFGTIKDIGSEQDIREAADFFATTAIGTAHHAFLQREGDDVMYHRAKLPKMVNAEADYYTSQEELIEEAASGLRYAADLADAIETGVLEGSPVHRMNERLGRSLARTGLTLAVISQNVSSERDDMVGMQYLAWQAGQGAYTRTVELSGRIGARPTIAQLADEQSPLRRYMNDDPDSVSDDVYRLIVYEVESQTP